MTKKVTVGAKDMTVKFVATIGDFTGATPKTVATPTSAFGAVRSVSLTIRPEVVSRAEAVRALNESMRLGFRKPKRLTTAK